MPTSATLAGCVIGTTIAGEFGDESPVGRDVRIMNVPSASSAC
jgi:hypothetical protein